mgnify:CR=1 FL=1
MRVYSSFEEIDKDLKILKLQTEIDKEEIKLSLDQTRENLKFKSLVKSSLSSVAQKILSLKAVGKILGVENTDNTIYLEE